MPFIDLKISIPVPDDKKEKIVAQLGKDISIMNKPESYLMIGILDNYHLWFGGKKVEKGAMVQFSGFGDVDKSSSNKMTGAICNLLKNELGLVGNNIYVTYTPIHNWGWDGNNF